MLGAGLGGIPYVLAQVDGAYVLLPTVLIGGYFERPLQVPSGNDTCGEIGVCPPSYFAFGPRVEFQPFPDCVIGPWLGGEFGVTMLSAHGTPPPSGPLKAAVIEATLDVGVEARPTKSIAVGPYGAWKHLFSDPQERDSVHDSQELSSLGFRVAGRF